MMDSFAHRVTQAPRFPLLACSASPLASCYPVGGHELRHLKRSQSKSRRAVSVKYTLVVGKLG